MAAPPLHTEVALVEANSRPLGVQLVNSRKTNKISEATDLVELAQAIQKADEFTKANVGSKLTVIAEQMQFLQNQARKILEDARRDAAMHHAACNLVKKAGTIYYLYQRESGQNYLSLLSPHEWGVSCPHEFLGGYRLEYDQSWTPIPDLAKKDQANALIDKIFNSKHILAAADPSVQMKHILRAADQPVPASGSQIIDVTEPCGLFQES
ncbi:unnamed protein product [Candidula unifasciata]|uniref:Uncharacterized protein n=1 Tax=Candidula unifasciata TaxID=100452 RepID=A0A8S3ZG57_9EUPU|nr:unnamed protein product [Candidula unifasciata]